MSRTTAHDNLSTLGDYCVTLAPWAGYVAFTNLLGSWKYGFAVGLGLSAAIVGLRTYRRDSRFMDVGTLAYCAAMTAVSVLDPSSPVRPYNLPLSMAAVGGLSSGSLAMRSPFTYRIARRHVADDVLGNPIHHGLLYRAHVVATSSWALAQGAAAAASAACVAAGATAAAIAVQAVGTLVPVATTRFQHHRADRAIEADRAGEPALSEGGLTAAPGAAPEPEPEAGEGAVAGEAATAGGT